MWLSQLALVNFRNLASLRLELESGVLLFCGRNGQGKTNLLESVYVLATTRSPRTSLERELLNWRSPADPALAAVLAPFARLEARVRRLGGEVHLELALEAERTPAPGAAGLTTAPPTSAGATPPTNVPTAPRSVTPSPSSAPAITTPGAVTRTIKVNGLPTRASGLVGQLPVVYFSPGDVELAGGPPAGRRQYLNLANSQASADHMRALQRYNRVLLQRNQVLRLVRERRQPTSALEPWTEQMVDWGARILRQRLVMLARINARVGRIFSELAGSDETLEVAYRSTACGADGSLGANEDAALGQTFRAAQAHVAAREVDQAVSLIGPHRDDFTFMLDGVDLNRFGSRGQQRLAVLALKLAEADWMGDEIGELPVILLDDVLSELDPARRGYVLQRVADPASASQRQVWITSTESAELTHPHAFLSDARRFEIDAGHVRPA